MDLSLKTESFTQDRRDWLGSAHGTDAPVSITLDVSKFTAAPTTRTATSSQAFHSAR